MEKFKLPELKVTSFVTSLDDQSMNQIHGGSGLNCQMTQGCSASACSSSDQNEGLSCTSCSE